MADAIESPTAEYYREKAVRIRQLARRVQTLEAARELLETAERFERMAAYVERRS